MGTVKSYLFSDFELIESKRILLRQGKTVKLSAKAFDLLLVLVKNNGQVVDKDRLLGEVWNGSFVEENNLTVQISNLRKALRDTKDPYMLQTVPGRGYCFAVEVLESDSNGVPESVAAVAPASDQKQTPVVEKTVPIERSRSKLKVAAATAGIVLLFLGSAALVWSLKSQGQKFTSVNLQQATTLSRVSLSAISRPGNFFAYVLDESEGQSLWVRQVIGKNAVQISPPSKARYAAIQFSPDGEYLYYSVFKENNPDLFLFRVPSLGGIPEDIGIDTSGAPAFSPDGARLAYIAIRGTGKTQLRIANADGKSDEVLAERPDEKGFHHRDNPLSWSPDGKTLAAIVTESDEQGSYMTVVGIDSWRGGGPLLTKHRWVSVSGVAWLRDASGFVLTAREKHNDPTQIWLVSHPSGEARRITNDLDQYEGITVSDKNEIMTARNNITGELAIVDGRDNARPVIKQSGGFGSFAWLGGDRFLFSSAGDFWSVAMDGSDKKQLTKDSSLWRRFDYTQNGNFIVFDSTRDGKTNLWKAGLDGGETSQITTGDFDAYPSVSVDGARIAFQRGKLSSTVWKMTLPEGEARAAQVQKGMRPVVSPDGKQIAYFYMDQSIKPPLWRIGVADFESGERTRQFEIAPTVTSRFMRWAPDGKSFFYIDNQGETSTIVRQPLDGSPAQPVYSTKTAVIESFAFSATGQLAVNTSVSIRDAVLISGK